MSRRGASNWFGWIVALALLGAAGWAAWRWGPEYLQPQVKVTKVVEGPVVQAFYATGTLQPDREYPIRANNAGALVDVKVDKGDHVALNQELAVVAEDAVQFRFSQAKAEREQKAKLADEKTSPVLADFDARLTSTGELLEIARRQQKRLSDAIERAAAAEADLDRAIDRVRTLAGELAALKAQRATKKIELDKDLEIAEAALKIAQWNLDRQTVRCPIADATILTRPLPLGTRINVNDPLMVLADVRADKLIMRAQVDEEDITRVKIGGSVRMTLYAYEQRQFRGTVKKVYEKADPDRRTFEVDVEMIDKDPAFSDGMTGELAFIVQEKDKARIVPSQAVQSGKVYIVRDGLLMTSDATIGLRSVERTEIATGLTGGESVVISPVLGLTEGQRVRTVFTDPIQAALLNRPKKQEIFKGGF